VNYVGNSYYLPSDKGYERILWKLRGYECVERSRTTGLTGSEIDITKKTRLVLRTNKIIIRWFLVYFSKHSLKAVFYTVEIIFYFILLKSKPLPSTIFLSSSTHFKFTISSKKN